MLVINDMGEFIDDFDPYSKHLKIEYHNPNDRMFHPIRQVRKSNRCCARCGKPFYSQQSNHIYCSADCQRQADNARKRERRRLRNAKS